jgi:cysteine synthase A
VSEAYFARMLGLPFIAVVPATTACEKIAQIEHQGGRCHRVADPRALYAEAERLARDCGGHYMDQFTYAERATDWRGTNNIAQSIFDQMRAEASPVPTWIVCGAGTGAHRPPSGATSAWPATPRNCASRTRRPRSFTAIIATGP